MGLSSDAGADIEPEYAESLIIAQLLNVSLDEFVSDPLVVDQHVDRQNAIERIQRKILQMETKGESFSGKILLGSVFQFWLQHKRPPLVKEIAASMRLSRSTFYRRYTRRQLDEAFFIASGEGKQVLPHPSGLSAAQRASLDSKKPGFSQLHRDPYADD